MDRLFAIGDFCFRLICPDSVVPPENFMRFAREQGVPAYTYTVELTNSFPQPRGRQVACRPDLAVLAQDALEMRYIGVAGVPGFYACYREEDERSATVFLHRAAAGAMGVEPMFLSMLAMERHLLQRSSMVLHCAYMQREGKAILFSAPSGTGKTTQATLWEKHRGTRVVNGDRALLSRADGIWTADGWPVCGSSGICRDERMPIRAIVLLSQAKENAVERLAPFVAFSLICSQITVNFWNRDAQQRVMELTEQMVRQVPVYHLGCTISAEAVACLETALRKAE